MQNLRGVKLSTKVTAFLILVLGAASSLTLIHPQPVNAEGYLFGKVRCVVQTVFSRDCEKKVQPATEAPQQGGTTSNTPSTPAQNSGTAPAGGTQATPAPAGSASLEPIEIPEEMQVSYAELELPKVTLVTYNSSLNESEYSTYFNTFSPYAVAGAHTTAASSEAPVQRSAEGWKLFGIAWYWWAIAGVAIGVLVVSGRSTVKARSLPKP